ncbi:hypothetical protein J7400_01255 [Shimia sp. R9_2]|uniref:hypothetical protein n=1 Tax=Shimia sp. R9_2 TaxID=2821112 RepID=UPI001ADD1FAD|nr:hypothetical protein [Shimia sp. R9_2]MBO9395288.1 hypothetical protein [Shimia sp. R9_2]
MELPNCTLKACKNSVFLLLDRHKGLMEIWWETAMLSHMEVKNALEVARGASADAKLSVEMLPEDIEQCYGVSFAQVPRPSAWKIGGVNAWSRKVFENDEAFFGPLSSEEVCSGRDNISIQGLRNPLAEPEIMLQLSKDNTGGWRFSQMGIGFELPATVLPEGLKPELRAQVCDRAGAGALWISGVQAYSEDLLAQNFKVETWLDSRPLATDALAQNVIGGPLGAARDFIALAERYNAPLSHGQWIATGGLSPAVSVNGNSVIRVKALCWDVSLRFSP